ncbi:MAG: type II secretion system protein [Planctomycetota bacterium]
MTTMRAKPNGFTLIEITIAILITGLLFLGFFSIIRNGINTQIMVREFSDAERAGPAILSQLSEDLRNAYFYNVESNAFFYGKAVEHGGVARADQIHFLTTRSSLVADPVIDEDSGIDPHSPLTEVSWMLREGEDDFFQLVRREQAFSDDDPFRGGYLRLISDRIVSFKVQYTGWDFGVEEGEGGIPGLDPEAGGGEAPRESPFAANGDTTSEDEEATELVWEDDWSSEKKGSLPVAIKVELVISPDLDPEVMRQMQFEGRLGELDRSYVQIILLPQFREDPETMRRTYAWTGSVAEPQLTVGGGQAGGVPGAAGGARGGRGDARGGGNRGSGGTNNLFGGNRGGRNGGNSGNGGNRLTEILRGGGNR